MRRTFILALLGLAIGWSRAAAAETPRRSDPLSEQEVVRTYTQMLRDACRYADRDWKTSAFDPAAGFWGDGASSGNQGTRAVAGLVLACGTLLKYDAELGADERRALLAKTTAALRYAAATHVTGAQKCPDGKAWGDLAKFNWQSGMWTGTLAWGAWLIWDELDPALQRDLQRVIAFENDVLAAREPEHGLARDTKAEENAWEVPPLVLGELMFPAHPHAAAWRDAARSYMMNTLCTDDDTRDARVVDGRAVRDWVRAANVQPDFTLENHNIFHPSYVGCSSYFLTQAALYYTYAGRPVPPAAAHHLMDTWRMFRTVLLPWGESAYPQGMDWELHGLPFINLFAALGSRDRDPFAARMEQGSLRFMREWQVKSAGSLAFPGSTLGFTRHAINAEQAAYGFLAHKIFGPAVAPLTASAAAAQEEGVWDYPYVGFTVHRTAKKFAVFSWKNRIMGQLLPLGAGHEDNPNFSVPIANGMIGSFELTPKGDVKSTVVEHACKKTPEGFETSGTVLLNGGRLRQTLRMISTGSQLVVYEDRVTAVADVTVCSERGAPLGIENDEITGGRRVVSSAEGAMEFEWKKPQAQRGLAGTWANVDGRMGVVRVAGAGLAYAQAPGYARGISVCADTLYGSFSDQARSFKAGEDVACRVVIFAVEITPEETAALARSCKIETSDGGRGRVLRFKPFGGGVGEVRLQW